MLLASDGLTGMLEDELLVKILSSEGDPQSWVDKMIAEANRRGGLDNITAIVVRIDAVDQPYRGDAGDHQRDGGQDLNALTLFPGLLIFRIDTTTTPSVANVQPKRIQQLHALASAADAGEEPCGDRDSVNRRHQPDHRQQLAPHFPRRQPSRDGRSPTGWTVEDHPHLEIVGKLLESMHGAGRNEEHVAGSEAIARRPVDEPARAASTK